MIFKRFNILILLQLLLIALNSFVISWTILQDHLKLSTWYFSLLLILQIVLLFMHITRQNKQVYRFLESFKFREELSHLPEKDMPGTHLKMRRLLNEIATSYSQVKIEKENEHFYFLNTIKHVNVGLISFDESGIVEIMNDTARELLKVTPVKHISELDELLKPAGLMLKSLEYGKPRLVKLNRDNELMQLSFHATSFVIKEQRIVLVSIQDIRNEIQQEEIEIWQKLIRVLTHEIMNSAGPITSLSATIAETFREDISPFSIGEKLHDRMVIGLNAIQKRSRGLAKFVDAYRNLTKLPKPILSSVSAAELLGQTHALMQERLEQEHISFYSEIEPENLQLEIDEKLMGQVLINLIKNAIEALQGRPDKSIILSIRQSHDRVTKIVVEDNGSGIPAEVIDRVFVPFFTTRAEGSGIGLSLSRQIISQHGGTMILQSKEGDGTRVEIRL